MGLGINKQGGDGDFKPYAKYNAKAGRWYYKAENGEVEAVNPTFVADFDNIKTGWFMFAEGQAPSITYHPSFTEKAPRPSDKHKEGVEFDMFSKQSFGGVVTMTQTSMMFIDALNGMFDQYEAEKGANAGKLPVITCVGVEPVPNKHGTNYKPKLQLVKWVDRPAELDAPSAASQAQAAPVATPAPAPAQEAVSEF